MSALTNSLHQPPVSCIIANALYSLMDNAFQKNDRDPSFKNRTFVVLTGTLFVAGNTLNLVVVAVETVASTAIGGIACSLHLITGCRSLALQKFTIQSFSYNLHSARTPYMIYSSLFLENTSRPDLSTFEKHSIYGSSAAVIHIAFSETFDYIARREPSFTNATGNELLRDWLNKLIPEMISVMATSNVKNSDYEKVLVPKLFELLLKEKKYEESRSLHPHTIRLVKDLWNNALEICPASRGIHPRIIEQGVERFRSSLLAANSMTAEELIAMIRNGDGIFAPDYAAPLEEHRDIRDRIRSLPNGAACLAQIDRLESADRIYNALESNVVSDAQLNAILHQAERGNLNLGYVFYIIANDDHDLPPPPPQRTVRIPPGDSPFTLESLMGSLRNRVRAPAASPEPLPLRTPSDATRVRTADSTPPIVSELVAPASVLRVTDRGRPVSFERRSQTDIVRSLVKIAFDKAYEEMPQLFATTQTDSAGRPTPDTRPLREKTAEGKDNLSSDMCIPVLANYVQYLVIALSTHHNDFNQDPARNLRISAIRQELNTLTENEKRIVVSKLVLGEAADPEVNKLAAERAAIVNRIVTGIVGLGSVMVNTRVNGYNSTLKDTFTAAYQVYSQERARAEAARA